MEIRLRLSFFMLGLSAFFVQKITATHFFMNALLIMFCLLNCQGKPQAEGPNNYKASPDSSLNCSARIRQNPQSFISAFTHLRCSKHHFIIFI